MKAITLKKFGGPENLLLTTIPQPIPAPNQILVHVKACALNRADLLQRRGLYPPPAGASEILGIEIAGTIAAMGTDVNGFGAGEKVFGLVSGGAYAEYCLIDQGNAMPIPENFSFVEAAAIPEAFLTAQEAIFTLGQLQPHESILIHAGGSGIGSAAIQLARQVDAVIYTTTGTPEKIAQIKSFGADYVINYKEQDFAEKILQLTENRGVNVIVDFIGAEYLLRHLQILTIAGRLSIVGLMRGATTEIDLSIIQKKRLQIKGLAMRTQTPADKQRITHHFQQHWLPLFTDGKLKPVIDSVFPCTEAKAAHEYMESNLNVGKIILSFE